MQLAETLATELRAELDRIQKPTKQNAGDRLAKYGLRFDEFLHGATMPYYEAAPDDRWFVPAAAQSLVWSHHAQPREEFLEDYRREVMQYLAAGSGDLDDLAEDFHGPLGSAALRSALEGYRAILISRADLFRGNPDSVGALLGQQSELINAILGSPSSPRIHGIGSWLGLSPYKIYLLHRRDWWSDARSDEVLLPLGGPVEGGLEYLVKHGIVERLKPKSGKSSKKFVEPPRGPAEEFGDVGVAQQVQRELAWWGSTRALHINSGLWLLGTS